MGILAKMNAFLWELSVRSYPYIPNRPLNLQSITRAFSPCFIKNSLRMYVSYANEFPVKKAAFGRTVSVSNAKVEGSGLDADRAS